MRHDLRTFLAKLEGEGELIHIRDSLSTQFEIPAVLKYLVKEKNVALQFDDVKGYQVPVVGNLLGSRKRLAIAMDVQEAEIAHKFLEARENPLKPVIVENGPVKDVEILNDVDIAGVIPVLIHHEKDAGPYFTCAVTIAKDPETGLRGMGLHRIQVKGSNTLGIFLASPPLSHFLAKAEENNMPLEVAVVVGVDPLTLFSSVVFAPSGIDKLSISGALCGRPVEVVRCSSVDLEVPANAEFVLEGHIIPGERHREGPFGESTGCYLTYNNPVIKITAITHRKGPIYHALMPFTDEEAVLLDYSWEMDNLKELKKTHACVQKVHMLNIGLMAIVQVSRALPGEVPLIIEKLLSNSFIKTVIVVDDDVDPYDYGDVLWAISTRFQAKRDLLIKSDVDGLMIDPSANSLRVSKEFYSTLVAKTSKMGIDATKPADEHGRFEKIDVPEEAKSLARKIIKNIIMNDWRIS